MNVLHELIRINATIILEDNRATQKSQKAALLKLMYVHVIENQRRFKETTLVFWTMNANSIATNATIGITTKLPIERSNAAWLRLADKEILINRIPGYGMMILQEYMTTDRNQYFNG